MLLPDSAPKVEVIEVVRIDGRMSYPYVEAMAGDVVALWDGPQAADVLGLIGSLPEGERFRCFTPGWGIRAHDPAELLFEIAFCFQCHGALLTGPGVPSGQRGIHTFDASSSPALELLQRFRDCVPEGAPQRWNE